MTRTPYSVAPYGVDQFKPRLGPSEAFDKEGYIFVLPGRRAAAVMSEGEFVEMRPHIDTPNKRTPTSTRAPTPTTRSTGC